MTKEEKIQKKKLKKWNKEKKLIPVMIRKYCHGHHHTKGKEVCDECKELTEYALFRLSKCPFKENKQFCSFCKIHCYKPDMRAKIKDVMRYSGPRMIFTNPIFSMSHVTQMIKYKKSQKKKEEKEGVK